MVALRLMAWIAVTFGRPIARSVLHPITLYFLLCAPAARRRSLRYLGRALGRRARWSDVYRHIHTFSCTVLDRVYFARGELRLFELEAHGVDALDATLAEGRGALLLGAHVGSFEALHGVGANRPERRVAMVMYPDNARMIQSALQAIAPGFHVDIIPLGRSSSTLAIRDWLDGGGLAGILGDRVLRTQGRRGGGIELPFLGRSARFSDAPLRLAMLLRRRVFFMVGLYRGGRRYDLRFEAMADFTQPSDNAAQRELGLRAALQSYVARLEALCREQPYNWFNFHDFWAEDAAR